MLVCVVRSGNFCEGGVKENEVEEEEDEEVLKSRVITRRQRWQYMFLCEKGYCQLCNPTSLRESKNEFHNNNNNNNNNKNNNNKEKEALKMFQ